MKVTIEKFKLNLKERHGDMYDIHEDSVYVDRDTKMKFICNLCNSTFETSPKTIMMKNRKGCVNCRVKNMNKPQAIHKEEFLKKLDEKYNGEFILVGEYVDYKTKTTFKHTVCGYENHITTPRQLMLHHSKYCTKCNETIKKNTKTFEKLLGEEYELLSEYKNNKEKVILLHKTCNKKYEVTPNNYVSGTRCPHCSNVNKTKKEQFLEDFERLSEDKYILEDEYKNTTTKLLIRHKECNSVFKQTPNSILNYGIKCSYCYPRMSVGEIKISEYLTSNGFRFETEKSFDTCVYKSKLRFDFFVHDIDLLIEFDGKQHYKSCFRSDERFLLQQERDKVKEKWCKKNKITLLRISYKDQDNIEEILYSFFNKYKI